MSTRKRTLSEWFHEEITCKDERALMFLFAAGFLISFPIAKGIHWILSTVFGVRL